MSSIQSYVDMPKDYSSKAEDYKAGDAEKVKNQKAGEVQKDVNANVAILDQNIAIANSNIEVYKTELDKALEKENAIDLELEKVHKIIHENSSWISYDFSHLSQEDSNLLKKYGIEVFHNTGFNIELRLKEKASRAAQNIKSELDPSSASINAKLEAEKANLKEFENEKNIQLNRVVNAAGILIDAETYGIGMALALFQLKCAKNSNDEAYVKLQEVKLAQNKSGEVTTALEKARNLKNVIDAGKGTDSAEFKAAKKALEDALTKVNTAVDTSSIKLNDGSDLTSELKAKLGKFNSIDVTMPSIDLSNDDKKSTSLKNIDNVVNILTGWQSQYSNKVNTIMVELNDASSKYSTFTSGANQSLQKATDLLTKLVGNFA